MDKYEELEDLERKYFMHQMCDSWDSSDYIYSSELLRKIRQLKNELNIK